MYFEGSYRKHGRPSGLYWNISLRLECRTHIIRVEIGMVRRASSHLRSVYLGTAQANQNLIIVLVLSLSRSRRSFIILLLWQLPFIIASLRCKIPNTGSSTAHADQAFGYQVRQLRAKDSKFWSRASIHHMIRHYRILISFSFLFIDRLSFWHRWVEYVLESNISNLRLMYYFIKGVINQRMNLCLLASGIWAPLF